MKEFGVMTSNTVSSNEFDVEPNSFYRAWNHPNPNNQLQWRNAIVNEVKNKVSRNFWTEVDEKYLPKEKKHLGLKWIFSIKSSGRYKTRIVSLGCFQRQGIYYNQSHDPVIGEMFISMLLLLYLNKQRVGMQQIDIEASFLEGKLDETI